MRGIKTMKRVLCVLLIVFVVMLSLKMSEGKEDVVCMTYFYVEECDDCDEFKRILTSLQHNMSYLHVEQYDMMEHYELFETVQSAYDAFYGVPIVFIGNEWFYFNIESSGFDEKLERFVGCIVELGERGGVKCVVDTEEHLNFPRAVCVREFYDFGVVEEVVFMERVERALEENISFVEVSVFDVSDETNYAMLQSLWNVTVQDSLSPCVFVGDTGFPADEAHFPRIVSWAKNFSKTGLSCPEYTDGKEKKDSTRTIGFEMAAFIGALAAALILKKRGKV